MKTAYAFALIMLALGSCDKGSTTIKSSNIKDAAITEVKHTCDSFNQSEVHKIQMKFDSLLIEYDKARKAFNKAKNVDQQTIAWKRQYKILLQEMELVKKQGRVTDKLTEEDNKRDTSKIKFLNIPPDQRAASLKHANEGLIYWKTNYTPWKHHFEQNPLGAPHSTYRFNAAEAIYFLHDKEFKAEFYCYVGEEDGKEQKVIIDVTKEQWVKDIFNQFYNAKIK